MTRTMGAFLAIAAAAPLLSGCLQPATRGYWREPPPPAIRCASTGLLLGGGFGAGCDANRRIDPSRHSLHLAEQLAARGGELDSRSSNHAAAEYCRAALAAWDVMRDPRASDSDRAEAERLHGACLARMLALAPYVDHSFGRPRLLLPSERGMIVVPIAAHGFAWSASDVHRLRPVGEYRTSFLKRRHARPGLGAPVVVQRMHETRHAEAAFLLDDARFAATAVLVPSECSAPTLHLLNPLRVRNVNVAGVLGPIASDISAPFAVAAIDAPEGLSSALTLFLRPDRGVPAEGLHFLEPYQPGKIPIVFIHGLLSDPLTWMDMANDLRATPGFSDRYQLWVFYYATGDAFLRSAAALRSELARAVRTVDPCGRDAALREIVLVGHSMGGLVAKLQVISPGDRLWRAAANRPLDRIVAAPEVRRELAESFFFEASPNVRRVVFIATPHGGSNWADRPVGRMGALMVRYDREDIERHRRIVEANPGVFSKQLTERLPTSVDMLEPDSPLLQAIRATPIAPYVATHSIIGTHRGSCLQPPGDGVVPIESARLRSVRSEVYVDAPHMVVQRDDATIADLKRILAEDWNVFQHSAASNVDVRVGGW